MKNLAEGLRHEAMREALRRLVRDGFTEEEVFDAARDVLREREEARQREYVLWRRSISAASPEAPRG